MKKRFWKKFIQRIAACVMATATLFSTSACSLADVFAWMSDNGMSSPIDITSNVHKTYFESGDGSKETPYVIANPLQLYYFAWLQNLGLFNVDGDDADTDIDTVYFTLANDIDMTEYQPLPSVGTTEYPFLGNFDGNGKTISNLTVENEREHLFEPPVGSEEIEKYAEIIGFFGVVGSLPQDELPDDKKYTYTSSANEIKNLLIKDITIATHTNNALVGFVAGYANGIIDCVGVVGGTIKMVNIPNPTTYTTNISDYTLIGYCTTNCKNKVYVFGSTLSNPGNVALYTVVLNNSNDGEGQGWGGSVKMQDIFTWLDDSMGTTSRSYTYTYERTDVVGLDGTRTTTNRSSENRNSYSVEGFGAYVGSTMDWEGGINFVGGGQKVTEYKYISSPTETDDVYYIKDGDYYLNFNGTAITSQGTPTQWYRGITVGDEAVAGAIYTVTADNRIYFLTMNNGNIGVIAEVDVDPANLPEWDFSNGKLSFDGTPIECNNGTWQEATTNTYLISDGNNNYLSASLADNGTASIVNQTNSNNATKWTITTSGNTRTISTVLDEETYYLNVTPTGRNSATLTTTTTPTNWTYTNGQYRISANYNGQSRNYYIRYNRGWAGSNSGTTLTLTGIWDKTFAVEFTDAGTAATIKFETNEYIDNSVTNGYYDNGEKQPTGAAGISYFPLSKDENSWSVASTNTGYIVGAEWGALEKGEGHDANDANIRISAYDTDNITNPNTPYTITQKTGGKFKTISDTSAETANSLGLQKYTEKLRKDYTDSIQQYCYGLHFMEASVSESNKAVITAKLKGETIDGYEVPVNCIDFNLYESGFINFVAGSYYNQGTSVNNSFFSMYKIERNSDGKTIESIKEICKIYGLLDDANNIVTSEKYYYTYIDKNGNEVDENGNIVTLNNKGVPTSAPTGYDMIFDCRWITHPNTGSYYGATGGPSEWQLDSAYYFEVPVNAGEYAIGSTKGRTGAYLVYLDLAANAQLLDRTKAYEKIVENIAEASVPKGVEMLSTAEGTNFTPTSDPKPIDPLDSAFVSINGGSTGLVKVEKTDENTIKVTTETGITAEYISVNTVLTDKGGGVMSVPITQTTTIERTTYRDKNKTTGDLTVTVLTKTTVETKDPNGTITKTEITYTKEVTVTDKNGNAVGDPKKEVITDLSKFVPDTTDPEGTKTATPGEDLINLAFAYGKDAGLQISYLYVPATSTTNADGTTTKTNATYLITIINPGKVDVVVKALLTAEGVSSEIDFIITDGTNSTTLSKTQDAQKVTITATADTPAGEPSGEPSDELTE